MMAPISLFDSNIAESAPAPIILLLHVFNLVMTFICSITADNKDAEEVRIQIYMILFMYKITMFPHLSALTFYFSSPFFSVDSFHVVNSRLSHSCCYFLHPRISRSSFSSSSKWIAFHICF